jgi:hypothetical protein
LLVQADSPASFGLCELSASWQLWSAFSHGILS